MVGFYLIIFFTNIYKTTSITLKKAEFALCIISKRRMLPEKRISNSSRKLFSGNDKDDDLMTK